MQKILWRRDGEKVKDDNEMKKETPGTLERRTTGTGAVLGGLDSASYTHEQRRRCLKREQRLKTACCVHVNTTASRRVDLHLHFLILYFLRTRTKSRLSFKDGEKEQTWFWNFPLFFCLFVFLFFCFWLIALGARKKRRPSQLISLPGLKQAACCLSVWTLNPVLSHVSHVKDYQVLVQIWSYMKEESRHTHIQSTFYVPEHTHTLTHTEKNTIYF